MIRHDLKIQFSQDTALIKSKVCDLQAESWPGPHGPNTNFHAEYLARDVLGINVAPEIFGQAIHFVPLTKIRK